MSDKNSSSSSAGIGLFGVLGVAFVVLKLCGVIHWSWWWVTAPFWGSALLWIVVILIIVGAALVVQMRK